jgi:hypothetical protein
VADGGNDQRWRIMVEEGNNVSGDRSPTMKEGFLIRLRGSGSRSTYECWSTVRISAISLRASKAQEETGTAT